MTSNVLCEMYASIRSIRVVNDILVPTLTKIKYLCSWIVISRLPTEVPFSLELYQLDLYEPTKHPWNKGAFVNTIWIDKV